MSIPGRSPSGEKSEVATGASERSPRSIEGTRWILVAAALLLLAAGLFVYLGIPSQSATTETQPFLSQRPDNDRESAVDLLITLDSVDAAAGSVQARVVAAPGTTLPPEGAVVFSNFGANPAIVVRPGQLIPELTTRFSFRSGDIADYPFDSYALQIGVLVVSGTDTVVPSGPHTSDRRVLPFDVNAVNVAAGFSAAAQMQLAAKSERQPEGTWILTLQVWRSPRIKGWVLAMIAIYWALALVSAGITVAIIVRRRPFDPRILAFLGALLFALIAFRNAAPGNPPIGTFLDFYAMFESVGIVAISLLALMITYLARSREGLDMI